MSVVRKLWVYACEWMAVLVLALRSGPEAPVPGRARPFPPSGAGVLARDGQKWQQAKPRLHGRKGAALPQSTAVSELERTKGTRLLNRNIA